jgi:hypothetical protein
MTDIRNFSNVVEGLALREEHRLEVSESKVLKRIFGSKKEKNNRRLVKTA